MEKKEKYKIPLILTSSLGTYLVFAILFGGISLLLLYVKVFGISAIFGVIGLLILIWLNGFKIILKKDRLIYKTLFSKNEVLYSNISQVNVGAGIPETKSFIKSLYQVKGLVRLELIDKTKKEKLSINLAVLSVKSQAIIADALISNTSAKVDELTKKMSKGDLKIILTYNGILTIMWSFLVALFTSIVMALLRMFGVF